MRKLDLTIEESITLHECQKHHPKHIVRDRCFALLQLNKGTTIPQIAKIIDIRTRTIYTWLDNWESIGIVAVMTRKGQGVKSKLSFENKEVVELVKKNATFCKKPKKSL